MQTNIHGLLINKFYTSGNQVLSYDFHKVFKSNV